MGQTLDTTYSPTITTAYQSVSISTDWSYGKPSTAVFGDRALAQEIARSYHIQDFDQVNRYLDKHSLRLFLKNALESVRIIFKTEPLSLDIYTDPETSTQTLILGIHTSAGSDQALELLNQLDRDWWLDTPFRFRDLIMLTLEFE
jgi:hypothetical protein